MFTGGDDQESSTSTLSFSEKLNDKYYPVISDSVIVIYKWIVYTILCLGINLFGIGTNIINIICFVKQGFKDPVNISLLGLAVSDLASLVTLIWLNIAINPEFMEMDLPFDLLEFQYLSGGLLHTSFTRVSGWITALITLERCLCIVAPLKVKTMVTPKRVAIIVVCAFIILLGCGAPLYVVNKLDYKFFPDRNKTLIGLVCINEKVEKISYAISNIILPFTSFVVTLICTVVLVISLNNATKWRKKSTTASQVENFSNRNQKVAKMVAMISTLFIVCFLPTTGLFVGMALDHEFSIIGKHRNTVFLVAGINIVLESINSSVNIFFYYRMSSKYRAAFNELFTRGGKTIPFYQNTIILPTG